MDKCGTQGGKGKTTSRSLSDQSETNLSTLKIEIFFSSEIEIQIDNL